MPKTFTENEINTIRNLLIQEGKELFDRYGLKKTSISQLTDAAGIAQGTFYRFFDSKEDLYFEILKLEESNSDQFLDDISKSCYSSRKAIKNIIKGTVKLLDANPIIRRLYDSYDYELLVRKLPPEKLENHKREDTLRVFKIINKCSNKNELINARPEVISALLQSITILYFHQDEIGRGIYPEVIDLLADLVADGLVKEKSRKKEGRD
jgi:AcrR family transcriptional regulator